jgi:hypothetical protein
MLSPRELAFPKNHTHRQWQEKIHQYQTNGAAVLTLNRPDRDIHIALNPRINNGQLSVFPLPRNNE